MIDPILFQTIAWNSMPSTRHAGERGEASWRTLQYQGLRVRLVEYSKDYKADHWCKAGHIVYCIEGEMISELADGRTFTISQGMSYVVSDNVSMHRSHSEQGVKLLIVDGQFLNPETKQIMNPWKM
jgi:quercetin dioxygenase-like cupin family protein